MVRISTLLLSFLAALTPEADSAYLVIEAVVTEETDKQPTWIAIYNGEKVTHIPANESIVAVEPGLYTLSHIDFATKPRTYGDGVQVAVQEFNQLELRPGVIYYIGQIQLERKKTSPLRRTWTRPRRTKMSAPGNYTVTIAPDPTLITRACHRASEVFSRFPLRLAYGATAGNDIRLSCDTP